MSGRAWRLVAAVGLALSAPAIAAPVGELIGPGVVRFHASDAARTQREPSIALVSDPAGGGGVPAGFQIRPEFSVEKAPAPKPWDADMPAEVTVQAWRVAIEPGTSLYGTGECAGPLLRNGRVTQAWNLDAYGYQDNASNLYTSHPWVLAVRADGTAFGVLNDTTYRVEIDLRDGITFRAHGTPQPLIVIEGSSPQEVVQRLGTLTGTIEMPPKWAVGYHQCRYSYYPESRVREVVTEFRRRSLPVDVIWLDIDYMDRFRVFTFDKNHFPDPAGLNAWLDGQGVQNVWMIDPGIARADDYFVFQQGEERDVWVKDASGKTFVGDVWPGPCSFPDYMNKEVRAWWGTLYKDFMGLGIDGVWNDMNEPAVFNVATKTMPEANLHNADPELGGPGTHAQYHNVYGMQMIRATRDGVMAANPDKRPFVLSRANFMGGHRYGATWTGDNSANWYHVDVSIAMTLNLSLSGQPFCGPDIGGFGGDGDAAMFKRWIAFGALLPFSRGHTGKGNIDKEPWAFGDEVEATARRALERRYRLLPHIYTAFEESHRTGMPVARPLFFADAADAALRSEDDGFLLGEGLLVWADPTPGLERMPVLPKPVDGVAWRALDFADFDGTGRDSDDPDQARLFVRPGAIVPTGPVVQHVNDTPGQNEQLTLIMNLDANGEASGTLYEDEGDGWAFRDGVYLRSTYRATRNAAGEVEVTLEKSEGKMPRPDRELVARVLLPDGREATAAGRDGQPLRVTLGTPTAAR